MLTIGFGQLEYSLIEDDPMAVNGSMLEICLQVSGGVVDQTVIVSVADQDGTATGIYLTHKCYVPLGYQILWFIPKT